MKNRDADWLQDHGLTTLLSGLATLTVNDVTLPVDPDRAFKLLTIKPARDVTTQRQGKGQCRTRRNLP